MAYKSSFLSLIVVINLLTLFVYGLPRIKISGPKNSFQYFSRDDWGAAAPIGLRPLNQPVPYVVIHHTYLPEACNTTKQCFIAMKSMQDYHNSMNWGDIGYNFCVGSTGGAFEGRGWDAVGIHAGRANNFSIGICLIGDWRVNTPPSPMLETTKKLISIGIENGSISPFYKLVGHNQIMATECPGEALLNIISEWDHFTREKPEFHIR